jgi:hypothetical protein
VYWAVCSDKEWGGSRRYGLNVCCHVIRYC